MLPPLKQATPVIWGESQNFLPVDVSQELVLWIWGLCVPLITTLGTALLLFFFTPTHTHTCCLCLDPGGQVSCCWHKPGRQGKRPALLKAPALLSEPNTLSVVLVTLLPPSSPGPPLLCALGLSCFHFRLWVLL